MITAAIHQNAVTASPSSSDVFSDAAHSKSVMRQTQGLMGVVLLGGVAAAYFLSMAWVAVPVVVGLGLLIAGLSGLCPMASLIARMPWNRAAEADHLGSSGGCCGGRC